MQTKGSPQTDRGGKAQSSMVAQIPGAGDRWSRWNMSKTLMLDTIIDKDRRVFHQHGFVTTPGRCRERLHQSWRGDTFGFWLMKPLAFVSTTDFNKCGLRAKSVPTFRSCGGCVSQLPFERCICDRMRETSQDADHHWLVLTWGVEQPPGDGRFRSAIGKTGESHVAAFVDNDVLWHFVDAGWNCRHKKPHTSVRSAAALGKKNLHKKMDNGCT